MDVEMTASATYPEEESQSPAETEENLVKCNCVVLPSRNPSSSNLESASVNSNPAITSRIVSDSPSHSLRICCLKQRFGSVFNSDHFSDVVFIIGHGEQKEKILAHRLVLAVGSPVFNVMLGKNWSMESAEIEIPDLEPSAFRALLRFLYTDEALLSQDTVIAILYAARKYAVEPLENHCVDFLIKTLCPDNVFTILNEGRLLDLQKLITSCLETIDSDTEAAVTSDMFCDVDIESLCLILSRDLLRIHEVKLFEALLRWSKAECLRKDLPTNQENQRKVCKKALALIRFPLMSLAEFSSKVFPSGLLTQGELLSIYHYLTTKPRPTINFGAKPRLSDSRLVVNRFTRLGLICDCNGLGNPIDFTCDCDLQLLGFGLHSSVSGSAKYGVILELKDTLTGSSIQQVTTVCEIGEFPIIYEVLFKNPIKVTAFRKYTARVRVTGPNCFMGKGGLQIVKMDLPRGKKASVTFSTHVDTSVPSLRTTVDEGMIPQLIFKV